MSFGRRVAGYLLARAVRMVTGAAPRWFGDEPTTEQRIYFANHSSHLDFLVLWASLPDEVREKTRPVAAADYWSHGFKGWLTSAVFRTVAVERGGRAESPEQAKARRIRTNEVLAQALAKGHSLILFPEGTRGSGQEVGAFRSGLYHLCVTVPGIGLVPVYLENLSRMLPKGEVLPIPLICKLAFGSAIRLHTGEGRDEFLARAHAALCALRGL